MPAKWHKYSYSAQRQERRTTLIVLLFVAFFAVLFWMVHSFIFSMYALRSDTMLPSLTDRDLVIATPLYNTQSAPGVSLPLLATATRGDLVVIAPPRRDERNLALDFLNAGAAFLTLQRIRPFERPGSLVSKPLIRRIVALPGDRVYIEDGILHVKTPESGHFLTEFELVSEAYDIRIDSLPEGWDDTLPFSDFGRETVLGKDEYFVLCDNRLEASDSRIWGPVPASRIRAKVFFRYWPLSGFGPVH